eukprot:3791103-Pleurochrysis_carterae.AAC.3
MRTSARTQCVYIRRPQPARTRARSGVHARTLQHRCVGVTCASAYRGFGTGSVMENRVFG